jgi:hypothetical protein
MVHDRMTPERKLRWLATRYQVASRARETARLALNQGIRETAPTMSTRRIAEHVGLSQQRVQQITARKD